MTVLQDRVGLVEREGETGRGGGRGDRGDSGVVLDLCMRGSVKPRLSSSVGIRDKWRCSKPTTSPDVAGEQDRRRKLAQEVRRFGDRLTRPVNIVEVERRSTVRPFGKLLSHCLEGKILQWDQDSPVLSVSAYVKVLLQAERQGISFCKCMMDGLPFHSKDPSPTEAIINPCRDASKAATGRPSAKHHIFPSSGRPAFGSRVSGSATRLARLQWRTQ